jgi:hypothetical protein
MAKFFRLKVDPKGFRKLFGPAADLVQNDSSGNFIMRKSCTGAKSQKRRFCIFSLTKGTV